jgi:hypothetical protein
MLFMNKAIAWLKDSNRWVVFVIIIPLFLYLFLSAFFHLNNFYSKSCQAAGWGWKLAGLVIMAGGIWIFKKANSDFWAPILLGLFICLMIAAFAGFNFSFA